MSKEITLHPIKNSLINPLESINILLELDLPKNKYPYLSSLYESAGPILRGVYPIEILNSDLDVVLNENEFKMEDLDEIQSSTLLNRKIKLYNDMMVKIKDDIIGIETTYANRLSEKSKAKKAAKSVTNTLSNINLDMDAIADELELAGVSTNHAETYAAIISKITNHMIRQILKMGREDGEMIMSASIKRDNQEMLNEEVNRLDKDQGIKLKHPQDLPDFEKVYDFTLENFTVYLGLMILELNDLRIDKYFEVKKNRVKIIKRIKVGGKVFRKFSPFFKECSGDMYELDTLVYRGRFLSYLFQDLIRYLDEMVSMYAEVTGSEFTKWEDRYNVLRLMIDGIEKFTVNWLKGKDYEGSLLFLYQTMVLMKVEKIERGVKDMSILTEQIDAFAAGQNPFTKFALDNSASLDTILKLAYVAMTEQTKFKDDIEMTTCLSLRDTYTIKERIRELGLSIINYRNKTDNGKPEIYQAFERAQPRLKFKFADVQNNEELNIGCRALVFLAILSNNKQIWNMVRKVCLV